MPNGRKYTAGAALSVEVVTPRWAVTLTRGKPYLKPPQLQFAEIASCQYPLLAISSPQWSSKAHSSWRVPIDAYP